MAVDLKVVDWATTRKEFVGFGLYTSILNWEAKIVCSLPKVKKSALWCPQSIEALKV